MTEYHRIIAVGRDLYRSSSPTPLPKQGHLEQVTLITIRTIWHVSGVLVNVETSPSELTLLDQNPF